MSNGIRAKPPWYCAAPRPACPTAVGLVMGGWEQGPCFLCARNCSSPIESNNVPSGGNATQFREQLQLFAHGEGDQVKKEVPDP